MHSLDQETVQYQKEDDIDMVDINSLILIVNIQ